VVLTLTNLDRYQIKRRGLDVVVQSGFSNLMPHALYGRESVYAIAKRQLTKREIAQLKW
jgi:hypothetical protein